MVPHGRRLVGHLPLGRKKSGRRQSEHDPTKAIPPLYGALLKNEQDVHMLERLAFMARRQQR